LLKPGFEPRTYGLPNRWPKTCLNDQTCQNNAHPDFTCEPSHEMWKRTVSWTTTRSFEPPANRRANKTRAFLPRWGCETSAAIVLFASDCVSSSSADLCIRTMRVGSSTLCWRTNLSGFSNCLWLVSACVGA